MSNPPYGVDWKQYAKAVNEERDDAGPYGRFAPGLPATSDGQMLFLLHLAHKMRPAAGRRRPGRHRHERLAAVQRRRRVRPLQHPPVAAGERPGRGDRRAADQHVLQHRHRHLHLDPRQHQAPRPQGHGPAHRRHRRSGPRCARTSASRAARSATPTAPRSCSLYADFADADPDYSKVLRNDEFGYWTITVERPLLDEDGKPVVDRKGKPEARPEEARHRERPVHLRRLDRRRRPARSRSSRRTSTPR